MKVDVYRNVRTGTLSVRDRSSGKVVAHPHGVYLDDVRFVVQPAGRSRVLREKRKNVHAFVRGNLVAVTDSPPPPWDHKASYNPYAAGAFKDVETGESVYSAEFAFVSPEGVLYRPKEG
jgi:hypothetical protein